MAGLNELLFRTGFYAAQHLNETYLKSQIDGGLEVNYNVNGTYNHAVNVYKSDMSYFGGAVAVQTLTIGLILLTYYGWWRLGRHVSFSPLEVAKVGTSVCNDTDECLLITKSAGI